MNLLHATVAKSLWIFALGTRSKVCITLFHAHFSVVGPRASIAVVANQREQEIIVFVEDIACTAQNPFQLVKRFKLRRLSQTQTQRVGKAVVCHRIARWNNVYLMLCIEFVNQLHGRRHAGVLGSVTTRRNKNSRRLVAPAASRHNRRSIHGVA